MRRIREEKGKGLGEVGGGWGRMGEDVAGWGIGDGG